MRFITCFLVLFMLSTPIFAQSFSCSFGKEPACLDSGAKVCSSFGKCVDQNTSCFDTYQCNYEGFTCKSNVTECVEQHDGLVRKFNDLVSDHDELVDKFNRLASDYEELEDNEMRLKSRVYGIIDCVLNASDLSDAQDCEGY